MKVILSAVDWRILYMLRDFAEGVIAARPYDQLIDRENSPYIERWYLARKNMVPARTDPRDYSETTAAVLIQSEIENLYLHRYARADREEPHCHPWPNATLVLFGWYDEEIHTPDGVVIERRNPGDVVLRNAEEVHAIIATGPNTISLFATMPKCRDWGFHTEEGLIPWQNFRAWKEARSEAA